MNLLQAINHRIHNVLLPYIHFGLLCCSNFFVLIKYFTIVEIPCGGNLTAQVTPQNFSSPFYPRSYAGNIFCEWSITTTLRNQIILLSFLDFQPERFGNQIQVSILKNVLAVFLIYVQSFCQPHNILTLIRTVFLHDSIGTYVDNCQHAVFTCFLMLMRGVFNYIFCLLVMDMQD